ncbi:MAG: hypothetical protein ABFD29_11310 [Anaerolineaceae bacterium]
MAIQNNQLQVVGGELENQAAEVIRKTDLEWTIVRLPVLKTNQNKVR